jgi:hypothetical protein
VISCGDNMREGNAKGMCNVARPRRGGATSRSTWWAFEVKLWGTFGINTHHATASMGKFLEMTLYHSMRLG